MLIYFDSESLNSYCLDFLFRLQTCIPIYRNLFSLLFNTGLRFSEAKQTNKWMFDGLGGFYVPTLKGGNNRYIKVSEVPTAILDSILSRTDPFKIVTNATASNYFNYYSAIPNIYCDRKLIKTHIFRHNLIKKLNKEGKTVEEISELIGEVDIKNTQGYIDSKLYYIG